MSALLQYKQKGRILRKHLAQLFRMSVPLSLAYEAVAAMEGASSWNEFSARLVVAPVPSVPAQAVEPSLPAVRAIFRTVDGKAQAEFDASSWFAQASREDIDGLMNEKPRMSPAGYELSYGGKNGYSDSVAEFVAPSNADLQAVYGYIKALHDAGGDCGGSDCYVDAHDVQRWHLARSKQVQAKPVSASPALVLDVSLGAEAHASLLAKVCALVRADAAHRHESSDYRPTVQDDIDEALAAFNIVATGEEAAYAPAVYDVVRKGLAEQSTAPVAQPEPNEVFTTFRVLEVMMSDVVGDYDVPDDIPEWQWVQRSAAFSHRDNGVEDSGGVWEFMVNVDCYEDSSDMPESLKPIFAKARQHRAVWVMFHQGT